MDSLYDTILLQEIIVAVDVHRTRLQEFVEHLLQRELCVQFPCFIDPRVTQNDIFPLDTYQATFISAIL